MALYTRKISAYNLANKDGKAKAKRISFEVNYSDFGKYIKRIDSTVATKLTKHISELKIKDID